MPKRQMADWSQLLRLEIINRQTQDAVPDHRKNPRMDPNQERVKQGWCWWYRKYAPGDTVLEGLEKEAREGQKGLWADPQPMPPWEWRKIKSLRMSQ
jgi:endonuclease YncB( thermonuclease family)